MKHLPVKEADIQNAICEYLELKGLFFWRQNNMPVFNSKTMSYRSMPKYSMKGVPDIIVISDGGYMIGIEVKKPKTATSPKTYLSKEQKEFKRRCEEVGAEYYVIRSVDELKPTLNLKTNNIMSVEAPEGMVYRVERKGKVDFLAKWVRQDFEAGKYCIGIEEENLIYNTDD